VNDFYVYILFHPETAVPFYVGKGRKNRMNAHRSDWRGNEDRAAVFRYAADNGLEVPAVKVMTGLSETAALQGEELYIAAIGRMPAGPLVNRDDGGRGGRNLCPISRGRIAAAARVNSLGRIHTAATIEKMKLAAKERGMSQACRDAQRIALKGKTVPREIALARGAKNKGKPHTPEHTAAIKATLAGRKPAAKTIEALKLYYAARKAAVPERTCVECSGAFKPKRRAQAFCCKTCSGTANSRKRANAGCRREERPWLDREGRARSHQEPVADRHPG
jgi:hypothetical protein